MEGPGRRNKTAYLLVSKVPRELLTDMGSTVYTIPADKLKQFGLTSPAVFIDRIAMVHSELAKRQFLSMSEKRDLDEVVRRLKNGFDRSTVNGFSLAFETGITSPRLVWLRENLIEAVKSKAARKHRGFVNTKD